MYSHPLTSLHCELRLVAHAHRHRYRPTLFLTTLKDAI
jgi:hypothetical protein